MIVLDYKDRRPLYEQVAERFKELIIRGVLPADTQMPSVRSQAIALSINPNTIQRAYSQLEQQGYLHHKRPRKLCGRYRTAFRSAEGWMERGVFAYGGRRIFPGNYPGRDEYVNGSGGNDGGYSSEEQRTGDRKGE